jgi:hypothetical protein
VLSLVKEHGLMKEETVGMDLTLLEANAAMEVDRSSGHR